MSIPAVLFAAATTLPAKMPLPVSRTGPSSAPSEGATVFAFAMGFTVLSGLLAARLGVYRPRKLVSADRLPRAGMAVGALLVFLIGLGTWVFSQIVFSAIVVARWHAVGNQGTPDPQKLFTPRDYALLSTVPPLVAFAVLIAGDFLVQTELPVLLGLRLRRAGRGFLTGMLAILVVGPWVFWIGVISESIYRRLSYQHAMEHDLLRSLSESRDMLSRWLIIAGATIAAPLFEELLFRGHLQTLLRTGLLRLAGFGPAPVVPSVPSHHDSGAGLMPGDFSPALLPPDAPPIAAAQSPGNDNSGTHPAGSGRSDARRSVSAPFPAWASLLAIVLTSLMFMAVHPGWSWPPIFVLSLGLGYVYERTGNLWAPIALHLLFNALETLVFVSSSGGG